MATYVFRCDCCGAKLESTQGGDDAGPCSARRTAHLAAGGIDILCWGIRRRDWSTTALLRGWARTR